jgi:hypothetical protein
MLALVIATLVVGGLLLGGPDSDPRTAKRFSTAVRNVGVYLVIATTSFPGTPSVTAARGHALFQTIVLAFLGVGALRRLGW